MTALASVLLHRGLDQGVTTGIGQDLDGLPLPVDGDGDGTAATDVGAYERRS